MGMPEIITVVRDKRTGDTYISEWNHASHGTIIATYRLIEEEKVVVHHTLVPVDKD